MKRYYFIVMLFITITGTIFASGKVDIPQNYNNLGAFSLDGNNIASIPLSYIIPDTVDKVFNVDVEGLQIHEMIGDGILIRPTSNSMIDIEELGTKNYISLESITNPQVINMRFLPSWSGDSYYYREWYCFNSRNPSIYSIKKGTETIYLTYSVGLPEGGQVGPYTVKFDLIWE